MITFTENAQFQRHPKHLRHLNDVARESEMDNETRQPTFRDFLVQVFDCAPRHGQALGYQPLTGTRV